MSSLLDGGTEAVLVYAEVADTDDDGNPRRVRSDRPTARISTRLHPLSAAEASDRGIVDTAYTFTTRSFPAGAWGQVWARGRWWAVTGEPARSAGSPMTAHSRVTITALGPEPLGPQLPEPPRG